MKHLVALLTTVLTLCVLTPSVLADEFSNTDVAANRVIGLGEEEMQTYLHPNDKPDLTTLSDPTRVYLRKATGNLEVNATSSTETYEAYFLIPVPFREQIPILVEVESPQLIDYRFIHLNPPNVIVAARMNRASSTNLDWTAWLFVKENTYSDLPSYAPIPTPEQLPDSVKKWLVATDCSQVSASIVQQVADSIRGSTTNLMELADDICHYCYQIPWTFPHWPYAFDAVYAITWGNSCTGHAHAGAALFRANGVPARSLLNIPTWYSGYFDMHWIIDYYVPDYGWVRMETSLGQNPTYAEEEIVTLACNPEDEFPLFYPCGIEGYWHTSDPALGMWSPEWGGAHRGYNIRTIGASTDTIEYAYSLTDSVFFYYSYTWDINLTLDQQMWFQAAFSCQSQALEYIQSGDLDNYVAKMEQALDFYRNVNPQPLATIFFDDFEIGGDEWRHGGTSDEWELGSPTYGPLSAHSGENCWGTDLDDTYENNADCWLISPPIDLENQACAYLSFWVWNWVEDQTQGFVYDPLWLDITTDGVTFSPLCSHMGGVNDDPEIPDVGGWTMIVLDLAKYLDNTVQIRFRFESDAGQVQPGSYIDDVHIYGRAMGGTSVEVHFISPVTFALANNYPNPFNPVTRIEYTVPSDVHVKLEVFNIKGQKVATLVDGFQPAGNHSAIWDGTNNGGRGVSSGVYFYKLTAGDFSQTKRAMLLE